MQSKSHAPGWSLERDYRWLLFLPALLLAMFFLWPIARVAIRSFTDPTLSLSNYVRIFTSGFYLQVIVNTVQSAAVVTLLSLLIAYPVAYAIAAARGRGIRILLAIVVVSLWTSAVIRSYAWMILFQRKGVLNDALIAMGLLSNPVSFVPGTLVVNVGMVHIMLPIMILPLLANMRSIDRSLLLAANVMGANNFAAFWRIFLPLSLPGVSAGVALVFLMSLGFFVTPALLGGPRHMMVAVLIEQQANSMLNWGLASALATLLLLLTIGLYAAYARLNSRIGSVGI
jgi:ABC-type spermidine/putrescine transport system permease subunit I